MNSGISTSEPEGRSDKQTPWERAAAAEGTTPSERTLTRLAKKAFLSLWSYSNVFTDEGRRNGKGDGKELCDLLVVFGNNLLLFSDKHCEYQSNTCVATAWPRWYKRAIAKSAKQLAGAENFLRSCPNRVFIDKHCQTLLPVALPDPAAAKYFLIAVTRGAHLAAREYFGGESSGSLILNTSISGDEHHDNPFHVGFPLPNRRFVHVLDELTIGLLLDELDTVPDFVAYLQCKEEFLQQPGIVISVPGEEDLLARYLATMRNGTHAFPKVPDGMNFVVLPEGEWETYLNSPQRKAKKQADEVSYLWDSLIEHQSKFIRSGDAITVPWQPPDALAHEHVIRALAEQPRLVRRELAADLLYALRRSEPGQMFARIKMTGRPPSQAFVFLTIPRNKGEDYNTIYRARRMHALAVYCHTIKEGMLTLKEAIGIASEPLSEDAASQDFMHVDLTEVSDDDLLHWRQEANELGILRPKTAMRLSHGTLQEFPVPFSFVEAPPMYLGEGGTVMTRAERRRIDREVRKAAKRKRPR